MEELLEIDNEKCILVQFENKSHQTGYVAWLEKENQENLDSVIENGTIVNIFWPDCEISSAAYLKKHLKKAKFKKTKVKILVEGDWLTIRQSLINVENLCTVHPSKSTRKKRAKRIIDSSDSEKETQNVGKIKSNKNDRQLSKKVHHHNLQLVIEKYKLQNAVKSRKPLVMTHNSLLNKESTTSEHGTGMKFITSLPSCSQLRNHSPAKSHSQQRSFHKSFDCQDSNTQSDHRAQPPTHLQPSNSQSLKLQLPIDSQTSCSQSQNQPQIPTTLQSSDSQIQIQNQLTPIELPLPCSQIQNQHLLSSPSRSYPPLTLKSSLASTSTSHFPSTSRCRSRSPSRSRLHCPSKLRSRLHSPSRSKSRSNSRSQTHSPSRSHSNSPLKPRSRSHSPSRSKSQTNSPSIPYSRSLSRSRSRSPRSHLLSRSRSRSFSRSRSYSPLRFCSPLPSRFHSRSFSRSGSRSPLRSRSRSPLRSRSRSPLRSRSRSPLRSRSSSPLRSRYHLHSTSHSRSRARSRSPSREERSRRRPECSNVRRRLSFNSNRNESPDERQRPRSRERPSSHRYRTSTLSRRQVTKDSQLNSLHLLRTYKQNLYKIYKKAGLHTPAPVRERHRRYSVSNDTVYLGMNKCVGALTWEIMNRKSAMKFLRELALTLWSERQLANRSLIKSQVRNSIERRSPVKLLTPRKLELYLSVYEDYIENKKHPIHEDRKKVYLANATEPLSILIRDLRKQFMREAGRNEE